MTFLSRGFVAAILFAGRKSPGGSKDLARKALAGAILSISLGLIPLITVMEVADGMIQGISARYIELATYHAQIKAYPGHNLKDAKALLAASPEISGAWIESQSLGVVFTDGKSEGVSVRGLEQGFLDHPATREYLRLHDGSLTLERPNDALIGQALADKLAVKPGSIISLVSVKRTASGSMLPKILVLYVKGIVSAGYREIDAQWLLLKQDYVEKNLPEETVLSFVGIKAGNPFKNAFAAKEAAMDVLPNGYSILAWREVASNLFESLASTRTMLLIIMAVTVAVASFNISSALTTMVQERQQEIALLRSVGSMPKDIHWIFAMGGTVLGAAGAFIGCIGGILVSININGILGLIEKTGNAGRQLFKGFSPSMDMADHKLLDPAYYLDRIPVEINIRNIIIIACLTILLSFLASLGPAKKAGSLSPQESFKRR